MTRDKYPMYGLAIVVGAAATVWAGFPPSVLLFLLVCPLMMFFMMRGMWGGQGNAAEDSRHAGSGPAKPAVQGSSTNSRLQKLDGSHESIDNP